MPCTATYYTCSVHDIDRSDKAYAEFGEGVFFELCKGVSRVLKPDDHYDLELFAVQVRAKIRAALAQNYTTAAQHTVIFALSYVQHDFSQGRFQFSDEH